MTDADPNSAQNLESELSGESTPEPQIPEKFKGKTTAEIIQILANTESELGRKNNEVGHLRRLTDQVLGLAQATRADNQQPKAKITSEDLLADPDKVVTDRIREVAGEKEAASEQRIAQLEGQLAFDRFSRKYPAFEQDLQDPKFLNWVGGTNLRQILAARAAQGDYTAADELFSLYGEAHPRQSNQTTDDTNDNLSKARKASLARGGGSAVSNTGSGNGKKVYKRDELIQLRIDNPEEFHRRFQDEFLPAYREDRVK